MKIKNILLGVLFILVAHVCQAKIMLQINTSTIPIGQTFRLTLNLDQANAALPDLTPLQQDFTIVGTQQNSSYTIVNGKTSMLNQWIILLVPKRVGLLSIPVLTVGQEKTEPLQINVTDTPINQVIPNNFEPELISLTAEVDTNNPYVNQEIIYTLTLRNSARLLDIDYQPPEAANSLVIPLGEGQQSQVTRNGRIYIEEQLRYAIYPQRSGALTIKPPVLRALILNHHPEKITVSAKPVTLAVKPAATRSTQWLPAKQVILSEQYDNFSKPLPVGATIVRTISIQANGVPAQLIPPISFSTTQNVNVYAEKPVESNKVNAMNLIGLTTIKVTYLFNKPGKITIPAIKLPWFNTITNQEEIAILPEKEILVEGTIPTTSTFSTDKKNTIMNSVFPPVSPKPETSSIAWWLVAFFALAWFVTLCIWFLKRSKQIRKKQVLKRLQTACIANQPKAAQEALIAWANKQWPNKTIRNLSDVAQLSQDPNVSKEINELAKALYDACPKAWQGIGLWKCVKQFKLIKTIDKSKPLPPMW